MPRKRKKTKYLNIIDIERAIAEKFGKKVDISFDKYRRLREVASKAVDKVIDDECQYLFP
jgi:hypothetical protein